ncbi:DUF6117 family protein [Planctellipticum variicoloris]|uniref:DUF6117 family protein n=1 Tax=Planctellipticum variicoloris TaxID=3064265 RepID=UPI003013375A|nr:DUF6117 family protein [Planctomycetaceae bacterium SH412]
MPLSAGDRANFDTLLRAVCAGDAALVAFATLGSGESVSVICAVQPTSGGEVELVPLAQLFRENPYELLQPLN